MKEIEQTGREIHSTLQKVKKMHQDAEILVQLLLSDIISPGSSKFRPRLNFSSRFTVPAALPRSAT